MCFVQAVEDIMNIQIPERAKFIRTIFAEMERIQNHYLWLGLTGKEMGFETLFMYSSLRPKKGNSKRNLHVRFMTAICACEFI